MFGRKQKNILVIKTDGLAGFVAAEPIFDTIRREHPDATISLLTTPALQRFAKASPYFDQVAAMPNFNDGEARRAFVKQLRGAKFERAYDLAGDEAARRLQSSLGVFGPKWFAVSAAPKRRRKHAGSAGRLPSAAKMLADAGLSLDQRLPDLRWALSARKDSANMKPSWYGISGPYGLLLPTTAADGRWPAAGYAQLASAMAKAGYMPVLAGPREIHDFGDQIADAAPQLVDLTGKTDHLQLAALAHEAAFFVSDDAEEMHLAVSVGCEGVLIAGAQSEAGAPEGRHVVTLLSASGPGAVDAAFVWRTLTNMGLVAYGDGAPASAQSR